MIYSEDLYCVQVDRINEVFGKIVKLHYPNQFTFAKNSHEACARVKSRLSRRRPNYTFKFNAFLYTPKKAQENLNKTEDLRLRRRTKEKWF